MWDHNMAPLFCTMVAITRAKWKYESYRKMIPGPGSEAIMIYIALCTLMLTVLLNYLELLIKF